MISVYDLAGLDRFGRENAICDSRLKRFRVRFLKQGRPPRDCLEALPAARRDAFEAGVRLTRLRLVDRQDSRIDGASKLIFETDDGLRLESVIMRITSGRTSLCVSSQVGCAAGCAFCATGKMGLSRNLTAHEILDQVVLAQRIVRHEGRTIRNVVFMGMGEPLHNEPEVYEALDVLRDVRGFYLAERHLLVSTVGMADAMERFVDCFPNIRLALSLHGARPEIRRALMPSARSQSLAKLRAVFPTVARAGNFMVEYLMLKGVNDTPADLDALLALLDGIPAHINLIQFNPHPGADFQAVDRSAREAFGAALRKAGFKVTLRYSLGNDIAAACGQLAGR